ncbi:MAG: carbohydrate ABC transporter substrate-binding protein [bacterium]|nr:carbohydrate ABC transporter substrate-binding protein [bacterium]
MKRKSVSIFVGIIFISLLSVFLFIRRGITEYNYSEAIEKWTEIFQPSVLNQKERNDELKWFHNASKDLREVKIKSVAEHIETHYWESRVLAKAFKQITGIEVQHEIIGEGQVVLLIMDQIENNNYHYDAYVNDADMVGTHLRTQGIVILSDYMKGEGKQFTNPYLDLEDFLNLEFGQDYDGNQLQIPDQQFANLYWFRYDWFTRDDIKEKFKAKYGYDLGVPVNWAAYEDIAEFFTNTKIDGKKVYGHLDYGKPSPSLGWRFTDAWFSIAGVGDKGLPNGIPVDEWGIRVQDKIPVGSSVTRGGSVNGPAAVYALSKYIDWLNKYAPPEALNWEWHNAGPMCARGDIAQRVFQYITWLSDLRFHRPDSPVCDKYGKPLWRVAPTPHGRYWEKGMKVGYQDAGSWTIPKNITDKKRAAAWLWAQFCISKSVALKKFTIGGTPIRKSTVHSDFITERMEDYGGLIEFYRSAEKSKWTDSGPNVPYYSGMSALWWKNIAQAIKGDVTPQIALDQLADQQDKLMASKRLKAYSPKLNEEKSREYWLEQPGAPKQVRKRQKPQTISYEELIKQWTEK